MDFRVPHTGAVITVIEKQGKLVISPGQGFDASNPYDEAALHNLISLAPGMEFEVEKEAVVAAPGGQLEQAVPTQIPPPEGAPQLVTSDMFQQAMSEFDQRLSAVEQAVQPQQPAMAPPVASQAMATQQPPPQEAPPAPIAQPASPLVGQQPPASPLVG